MIQAPLDAPLQSKEKIDREGEIKKFPIHDQLFIIKKVREKEK